MVTRSPLPFSGVHKVYPHPGNTHGAIHQQHNSSPKNGMSHGACVHPVCGTHRSSHVTARRSWCAALEKRCVDHQLGLPVTEISKARLKGSSSARFCNHSHFICLWFLIWQIPMAPLEILTLESLKARVDNALETRSGQMQSECN